MRLEMIPYTAQMDIVSYGTGKWTNPFADKSGAYIFLPDGPAKVSCLAVRFTKSIFLSTCQLVNSLINQQQLY